ncbi:FAD-dependent oxidoreductase [Streptomyces sp. KL116D]|uniref:FAD-dependent oxidoreductase n=1 Tax=Streptomyces sp. KL116D TaxID=3045152 RepID=UPI003558BEF0
MTADDGTVTTLTARHAVAVCTGTRAALPPLPGLADVAPWTSREATSAEQAPGRLIVVGGGVVATEMATAWQALGSQVTMLVRGGGLLNRMEPFAGELVTDALREAGADVRTGVSVTAVERKGGTVTATLGDGSTVEADEILFATGRAPRTDDIGLETVGLEPGSWLPVDDSCGSRAATGCTRSVTPTTGRSSPTRASTRPGSRAPRSPPARRACPSWRPTAGARTPPPPTTTPCPRSSSPTRRRRARA